MHIDQRLHLLRKLAGRPLLGDLDMAPTCVDSMEHKQVCRTVTHGLMVNARRFASRCRLG